MLEKFIKVLLGGAALAVFGVLVIRSRPADPELRARVAYEVHRLQELESRLDELVLETRFGFCGNYDSLAAAIRETRASLDRLGHASLAFDQRFRLGYQERLEAVRVALEHKLRQVDEFKSQNALLRNSMRYFPSALEAALAPEDVASKDDLAQLGTLAIDSIRFATEGGRRGSGDLASLVKRLEEKAAQDGGDRIGPLLAQVRWLDVHRAETDAVVEALLGDRSEALIRELDGYQDSAYAALTREATLQRYGLYGLSALLALYLLVTWTRLRRATAALCTANEGLEERIQERTAELNERNGELEREVGVRKRTEKALRYKNEELDEFTRIASHDLQEPLRKLISFSSMLRVDIGEDLPPRAAEDIGFITDAATRMQTLVQDLLVLSRAGKREIDEKPVDLGRCLDDALVALRGSLEEQGGTVMREPLPTVPGNKTLLTQLLQNLVGNALKFVPEGTAPEVRLSCEPHEDGVLVRIEDNGIGINPEYAEKIFAPFQRLHGRSEYEGSGIGLAICAKTVNRHGGRIWVESQLGEGACFCFTLAVSAGDPSEYQEEVKDEDGYCLAG